MPGDICIANQGVVWINQKKEGKIKGNRNTDS